MAARIPRFEPGEELSAEDLNALARACGREVRGEYPIRVTHGPTFDTIALSLPERIDAKISGPHVAGAYPWIEQHAAPAGTWRDGTRLGTTGGAHPDPAWETNGNREVPSGTIVKLRRSAEGDWRFQLALCNSTPAGTPTVPGTPTPAPAPAPGPPADPNPPEPNPGPVPNGAKAGAGAPPGAPPLSEVGPAPAVTFAGLLFAEVRPSPTPSIPPTGSDFPASTSGPPPPSEPGGGSAPPPVAPVLSPPTPPRPGTLPTTNPPPGGRIPGNGGRGIRPTEPIDPGG